MAKPLSVRASLSTDDDDAPDDDATVAEAVLFPAFALPAIDDEKRPITALAVRMGFTNDGAPVPDAEAVPVAVAAPTIAANSIVILTRVVNGLTPGKAPLVTITAGVGFTITADLADTSTYAWAIIV